MRVRSAGAAVVAGAGVLGNVLIARTAFAVAVRARKPVHEQSDSTTFRAWTVRRAAWRMLHAASDGRLACRSVLRPLEDTIPPKALLAVHFLHESLNASSFWAPYLRMVPEEVHSLPFFTQQVRTLHFSLSRSSSSDGLLHLAFLYAQELAELQCATPAACPVLGQLQALQQEVRQVFAAVRPHRRTAPGCLLTCTPFCSCGRCWRPTFLLPRSRFLASNGRTPPCVPGASGTCAATATCAMAADAAAAGISGAIAFCLLTAIRRAAV